MNHQGWDIDRIVSEVLRRLQSHASPNDAPSPPPRTATPETDNPETAKPQLAKNAGELCLNDRVVTLAAVKDRLQGIRHVRLCPNAVVTPSARDEFRKRGIAVERETVESNIATGNSSLVIALADANCDLSALLQQVGGNSLGTCDLVAAVEKLAEHVRDDRQLGVLLTTRPAPALCLANRHPGVRAATSGSPAMVRDAVQSVGANLLVIDPTGCSLSELSNTLREFIRGGTRTCPTEFCQLL